MKNNVDISSQNITKLYFNYLTPTLLGLLSTVILIFADGIFVGKGIGSDALAAINIVAPLFLLISGLGVMFGTGTSVIAAIQLSHQKYTNAKFTVLQSVLVSTSLTLLISIVTFIYNKEVASLFGCPKELLPDVLNYLNFLLIGFPFSTLLNTGIFTLRLDGNPNYGMKANTIAAVINIILDYVFIFLLDYGIKGAAVATTIGSAIGGTMLLVYLFNKARFFKIDSLPRFTQKRTILTLKTTKDIAYIGFPAFLSEFAIAMMIYIGNYTLIKYLGKDGVAAYSIICYCTPLIFMINNAIIQSAQPIISFNLGVRKKENIKKAFSLSVVLTLVFGILITYLFKQNNTLLISLFLDESYKAYSLASYGMSYFSSGMIFLGLNIVILGYYQSIKKSNLAIILTILRGYIFLILCFVYLPNLWGEKGLWLAIPAAELLTFASVIIYELVSSIRKGIKKRRSRK